MVKRKKNCNFLNIRRRKLFFEVPLFISTKKKIFLGFQNESRKSSKVKPIYNLILCGFLTHKQIYNLLKITFFSVYQIRKITIKLSNHYINLFFSDYFCTRKFCLIYLPFTFKQTSFLHSLSEFPFFILFLSKK